jgi:hypothetical protein
MSRPSDVARRTDEVYDALGARGAKRRPARHPAHAAGVS